MHALEMTMTDLVRLPPLVYTRQRLLVVAPYEKSKCLPVTRLRKSVKP